MPAGCPLKSNNNSILVRYLTLPYLRVAVTHAQRWGHISSAQCAFQHVTISHQQLRNGYIKGQLSLVIINMPASTNKINRHWNWPSICE